MAITPGSQLEALRQDRHGSWLEELRRRIAAALAPAAGWEAVPCEVHLFGLGQLVDVLERLGADVGQAATLPLKALSRMRSSSRYPIGDTPPADLFERPDSDQAIGTAAAVMAWLEGMDQPPK